MTLHDRSPDSSSIEASAPPALLEQIDALAARFGTRFLLEPAPDHELPGARHARRSTPCG